VLAARQHRSGQDEDEPACSVERSLQVLGERWSFLVLREIFAGRHRFAEMQASLGIASNLLSARLKSLVAADVLCTRTYQEPGSRPRQSYHLTDSGRELRVVLLALQQWGDRHRARPSGPSVLRRTRGDGRCVHVGFVDDDGQAVSQNELLMVPNPSSVMSGCPGERPDAETSD
jgi:DNA-binding HxlR family transcriptional regulator